MADKCILAIRVAEERSSGSYYHIDAQPAVILPGKQADWTCQYGVVKLPDQLDDVYGHLADIRCHSQGNSDNRDNGLYGWEVQYHSTYACLSWHEAARVAKALKAIAGKMDRYHAIEGRAESYGQFVGRFARAIGAKYMLFKSRHGYDYRYATTSLGDGVYRVNGMLYDWAHADESVPA